MTHDPIAMTLSRWLSIFSTIVCLILPTIGTNTNLATAQPPFPTGNSPQPQPRQIFLSKVNGLLANRQPIENYTGFSGYPLPTLAPVALSYGWYPGADGQTKFHAGIDLLANPETPVLSVDAGTVAFAGQQGNYGNLVVVNHPGGRQTRYAHLGRISVRTGQQVKLGTSLGTVGSTGSPDIDQPHLHFEVRYNAPAGWVAQDPELHLTVRP